MAENELQIEARLKVQFQAKVEDRNKEIRRLEGVVAEKEATIQKLKAQIKATGSVVAIVEKHTKENILKDKEKLAALNATPIPPAGDEKKPKPPQPA